MAARSKIMTVDELTAILNTVSQNHQTDLVVFTTSREGDIIRPRDKIDVYIRNNGHMGWLDFGHFAEDAQTLMGRKATFHSLSTDTTVDYMKSLNGVCAFSLVAYG